MLWRNSAETELWNKVTSSCQEDFKMAPNAGTSQQGELQQEAVQNSSSKDDPFSNRSSNWTQKCKRKINKGSSPHARDWKPRKSSQSCYKQKVNLCKVMSACGWQVWRNNKKPTTTTTNQKTQVLQGTWMRSGKHWLQVALQCALHPTYRPGTSSDISVGWGQYDIKEAFNFEF